MEPAPAGGQRLRDAARAAAAGARLRVGDCIDITAEGKGAGVSAVGPGGTPTCRASRARPGPTAAPPPQASVSPAVPGQVRQCGRPEAPAPGVASRGRTYCVALAVGSWVGVRAIVKRGVHPAPLIGGLGGRAHVQEGRRRRAGVRGGAREARGRKEETEIKEADPNADE